MFLRDVDLRVSLDATQHGKAENQLLRSKVTEEEWISFSWVELVDLVGGRDS